MTDDTLLDREPLLRGNLMAAACPSREVLQHVTSRWGVLVLVALLAGDTGKAVLAFNTLTMLAMLVTGMLLWWPARSWRGAFSISLKGGLMRSLFDMHRVGGVVLGGGKGGILGPILAVLILRTVRMDLTLLSVDPNVAAIIEGTIMVAVVMFGAVLATKGRHA